MIQINKKIEEFLDKPKSAIPITIDSIFKEQTSISDLWEQISIFEKGNNGLNIYNSNINNFLLTLYPTETENNKYQQENLKTNHYLKEAISILDDANSLKRN